MKQIVTKALLAALLIVPAASAFQSNGTCPRNGQRQGPRNGQPCTNGEKCDKANCPKGGQCDGKGPNGTGPRNGAPRR